MMNAKKMNKVMEELFKDINSDKTLVPKAREMNKSLSNMISFNKAQIEYNKMANINNKINIFE